MTLRQPLLAAALAFGLLAGCSRNTPEPRPAESGGTPSGQMEPPANDKPLPPPADATPPGEAPSGGTAPAANAGTPTVYLVRDSGVRCMAAPCPSYLASRPDRPNEDPLKITDVDMAALNLSDEKRVGLMEATHTTGLKVEATVVTVPKAGPAGDATVLRVTRVME